MPTGREKAKVILKKGKNKQRKLTPRWRALFKKVAGGRKVIKRKRTKA